VQADVMAVQEEALFLECSLGPKKFVLKLYRRPAGVLMNPKI